MIFLESDCRTLSWDWLHTSKLAIWRDRPSVLRVLCYFNGAFNLLYCMPWSKEIISNLTPWNLWQFSNIWRCSSWSHLERSRPWCPQVFCYFNGALNLFFACLKAMSTSPTWPLGIFGNSVTFDGVPFESHCLETKGENS